MKLPSRDTTDSGKRTPSTLAAHTCRPAIFGVTVSSGLGLGLSAAQPASTASASSTAPQPQTARWRPTSLAGLRGLAAAGAEAAAGGAPSAVSLASISRRYSTFSSIAFQAAW